MAPLALIGPVWLMGLALFVTGFAIAPTMIASLTMVQQAVPAARLSEGMSIVHTGLAARAGTRRGHQRPGRGRGGRLDGLRRVRVRWSGRRPRCADPADPFHWWVKWAPHHLETTGARTHLIRSAVRWGVGARPCRRSAEQPPAPETRSAGAEAELIDQPPKPLGGLDRIEILALQVFDERDLELGLIVQLADHGRDALEAGRRGRPQASLARDEPIAIDRLGDEDRLQDAVLTDALGQGGQLRRVEASPQCCLIGQASGGFHRSNGPDLGLTGNIIAPPFVSRIGDTVWNGNGSFEAASGPPGMGSVVGGRPAGHRVDDAGDSTKLVAQRISSANMLAIAPSCLPDAPFINRLYALGGF